MVVRAFNPALGRQEITVTCQPGLYGETLCPQDLITTHVHNKMLTWRGHG